MLASINAGTYVSESHPTVRTFRFLLDTLVERKCPKNSRQEIADINVASHQELTREGFNLKLLDVMIALNLATTHSPCRQFGYNVIAHYVVIKMIDTKR